MSYLHTPAGKIIKHSKIMIPLIFIFGMLNIIVMTLYITGRHTNIDKFNTATNILAKILFSFIIVSCLIHMISSLILMKINNARGIFIYVILPLIIALIALLFIIIDYIYPENSARADTIKKGVSTSICILFIVIILITTYPTYNLYMIFASTKEKMPNKIIGTLSQINGIMNLPMTINNIIIKSSLKQLSKS